MRTLSIAEANPAVAWLESTPREGQEAIRAELSQLPFMIGRNESCDLTIESARVSREHLKIDLGPSGYFVQDLGSTNGSFVNGVKIKEAPLADGDLLTVANYGLIFHVPKDASRTVATQMFAVGEDSPASQRRSSLELIEAARTLQELALHRAVRNRMQAIVEVATSEPIGYEVGPWSFDGASTLQFDPRIPNGFHFPAVARAHEISRTLTVEQAWEALGDVLMFLSVPGGSEVGSPDLLDSLERLKQRANGESHLVVQIPYDAVDDSDRFHELRDQLREIGLSVCIDRFTGDASALSVWRDFPPEYLKLAASVVQSLSRSPEQRRNVEDLLQTGKELGTRVIGCGVKTEEEWHACKSVGISLAQGEFAAAPQPLDACSLVKH